MENELSMFKSQKTPQNSAVLNNDVTRKVSSDQSFDYGGLEKLTDQDKGTKDPKSVEGHTNYVGVKGRPKECSIF